MSTFDKTSPNVSLYEGRELENKQQWITVPTKELRRLYFLKLKSTLREQLREAGGPTLGELSKETLAEYEKEWKKAAFAKYPYPGEYLVKRFEDDGTPVSVIGEEVIYVEEELPVEPPVSCESECYVIQINLASADIEDASGNFDNTYNNAVNFNYTDCQGVERQILGMRSSELGGFFNPGTCAKSEDDFGYFWYYKNDIVTIGVSTASLTYYCCEDNPIWGQTETPPNPNA